MQLSTAPLTSNPTQAFGAASANYKAAIDAITFAPNERVDVRKAIGSAVDQAQQAITALEPFTSDTNMFVSRNATSSVESAKTAVSALTNALGAIDTGGPAGPQIGAHTFLNIAVSKLTAAEGALWWE
ncbi:MAG: hypothetical protein JWL76_2256 [Thermoleophilia bacterium]|nr:hypothetical protein [Thermoleophilia bacterium]